MGQKSHLYLLIRLFAQRAEMTPPFFIPSPSPPPFPPRLQCASEKFGLLRLRKLAQSKEDPGKKLEDFSSLGYFSCSHPFDDEREGEEACVSVDARLPARVRLQRLILFDSYAFFPWCPRMLEPPRPPAGAAATAAASYAR